MFHYLGLFMWSFGVAIGPVISPGPVSAGIVTEGARRGAWAGPLISTGHALMELLMAAALMLGMGQVLQYTPLAIVIGLLGGLFLVWMGGSLVWQAISTRPGLPQPDHSEERMNGNRNLVVLGIATTVSNPFWYLWWIGAGGAYLLDQWEQGLLALLMFYLGHIAADYAWNTFLASVVASGRRWLTDRRYQGLLVVCGLFLIYSGLRFAWLGVAMGLH